MRLVLHRGQPTLAALRLSSWGRLGAKVDAHPREPPEKATAGKIARPTTEPHEWRELLRQSDAIGSLSLPLVALAGAATGVVLSMETRDSLSRFGAKSMLPAVIVFSILKDSGPVITGLVVSGRVGAGIGAERGSMKVTEQIDAMEASAMPTLKPR